MGFTKKTLDEMLETIMDIYLADNNTQGLWEVVEYVKDLYKNEIDKLENKKIHHARADTDKVNGLFNQMFKGW